MEERMQPKQTDSMLSLPRLTKNKESVITYLILRMQYLIQGEREGDRVLRAGVADAAGRGQVATHDRQLLQEVRKLPQGRNHRAVPRSLISA